jgi:hypothetical protein
LRERTVFNFLDYFRGVGIRSPTVFAMLPMCVEFVVVGVDAELVDDFKRVFAPLCPGLGNLDTEVGN